MEINNSFLPLIFRVMFTSSGAVAEIIAISIIFSFEVTTSFYLIVLFLIVSIYLWDFLQEYKYKLRKTYSNILLLLIAVTVIAYFYLVLSFKEYTIIAPLLLLFVAGMLYNSLFKKITSKLVGFKDLFVVVCWNALIALLLFSKNTDVLPMVFFLVFVFLRDFINITFCDIKDVATDSKNKLRTFAVTIGMDNLFRTILMLGVVSFLVLWLGVFKGFLPDAAKMLFFPVILSEILLIYSKKYKNYSPNIVDLEYFAWLLFVLLGRELRWIYP